MKDKTNNLETAHKSETDKTMTTNRRDNNNDQKIILIESLIGLSINLSIFL
tara:strand:- start:88 stop:240 length:153 start_codon:yes stop_codon:yes gene_type:complete